MGRLMRERIFDLNDADDARDYLTTLESEGKLSFDGMDTAQELDDVDAIEVARTVFLKFNQTRRKSIQ